MHEERDTPEAVMVGTGNFYRITMLALKGFGIPILVMLGLIMSFIYGTAKGKWFMASQSNCP